MEILRLVGHGVEGVDLPVTEETVIAYTTGAGRFVTSVSPSRVLYTLHWVGGLVQ